ncbi:MAG TPA: hypothetical protein VHA09_06705 [Nitrososphaera sp.]|nr:hypothetical protein [Nitrososphaera sp.]
MVAQQGAKEGEEKLRCNICDVIVDDAAKANEHSMEKDHALRKLKLEVDLKETAARKYNHDNSVIVQWTASIHHLLD